MYSVFSSSRSVSVLPNFQFLISKEFRSFLLSVFFVEEIFSLNFHCSSLSTNDFPMEIFRRDRTKESRSAKFETDEKPIENSRVRNKKSSK